MKILSIAICLIISVTYVSAKNQTDSLLKVLDKTLSERAIYAEQRESRIQKIKQKINRENTLDEKYSINKEIIEAYRSYLYDSAIVYIYKNIELANKANHKDYQNEAKLQLSFVLSLSGLFTQSFDILSSIKLNDLKPDLQKEYCLCYLRYYDNLIKYTNDDKYTEKYALMKDRYRDTLMSILPENSIDYQLENALQFRSNGKIEEALNMLTTIFIKCDPATHQHAMTSMNLANTYKIAENADLEQKYLIIAAITDTKLAVKENEALLHLAIFINKKGDINRAYKYIKISLEDANFYNSRFRNTIIARAQPIIEKAYLLKIEQQSRNLKIYAVLISLFVIAFGITIYYIYKQIKIVSRAKRNLRRMNEKLGKLNHKLDEANLIKEEYIGYFMNQCSLYIDKLDEYRKHINRKIVAGQIDDLYKLTSSTRMLDKDVEELYNNFDTAFLRLYPNFVEEFNNLLKKEEHYKLKKGELNTELRIFALIRLGITDSNQISVFLRYSLRTIYNYRSKVKRKSIINNDHFEDEVKKIGSL